MTRVRIPPTLRDSVGGAREVDASGSTVRELLADLAERFPGLGSQVLENGNEIVPFVNVYVNNEDVRTLDGLETPVGDGTSTLVTETFDWSTSIVTKLVEVLRYPERHLPSIERSLRRLDAYVTHRAAAV